MKKFNISGINIEIQDVEPNGKITFCIDIDANQFMQEDRFEVYKGSDLSFEWQGVAEQLETTSDQEIAKTCLLHIASKVMDDSFFEVVNHKNKIQ